MLEINCNKCENLSTDMGGTSTCKIYGPDCEEATRACATLRHTPTAGLKPRRLDHDLEDFFRASFCCPVCGRVLASYTYGRAWTDNRLSEDKHVDCDNCGQNIDWSEV